MIKKLLFIVFITTNLCLYISAGLTSTHWRIITRDIARDGDSNDREEFEAARQAFLHIKDEPLAKAAALDIERKWKKSFGREATAGSKKRTDTLMSLTRYPLMTREQAKETIEQLLENKTISQFLDEQKLKVIQK